MKRLADLGISLTAAIGISLTAAPASVRVLPHGPPAGLARLRVGSDESRTSTFCVIVH